VKCRAIRWFLLLLLGALGGCASTGEDGDARDPFEGFNRGVYRFNDEFDNWVARPVATVYKKALHPEIVLSPVTTGSSGNLWRRSDYHIAFSINTFMLELNSMQTLRTLFMRFTRDARRDL